MVNVNIEILDVFPDPVILVNRAREVVFANKSAENILGASYEGRDLALSFRHPAVLTAADDVLAGAGKSQGGFPVSTRGTTPSGAGHRADG